MSDPNEESNPTAQTLSGRVALVTGGGSGIGEAIARTLAGAGAAVAVSGRRQEAIDATSRAIEEAGGKALAVAGDVARPEDARRMVEDTAAAFGALHILVNNAGIAHGGPIGEMSDGDIEAVVDIDLKGPIHALRAALPRLREHRDAGGAAVVNISSSVTQTVLKNYSVYSAAKAGLDQLTRCWGLELAADRVRVNAVCPGVVETPIFKTVMPERAVKRFLSQMAGTTPLGRVGQPRDVARLVLFLASPDAEWMTGAIIPLDGGVSLAGNV